MANVKRGPPLKMDFQGSLSGVTCDSSCTEPCSSFQELTLSPTHTVRVYQHLTGAGTSYVFTNCSDGTWTKSDDNWYTFTLATDSKTNPLLKLELDGVLFDYAQSSDARGLQLLIAGRHYIDSVKDPKGCTKIRFCAIVNNHAPCSYPDVQHNLPDQLLGNHSENLALVFLSTIVLFHLLNTRHLYQTHSHKYNETIFVTMIQCVISVWFQLLHCIAFPILFYRRIHEYVMDFITFMFLVSDGFAIYFATELPYTDWVVLILQLMSLSVCIKVCLKRKESTF